MDPISGAWIILRHKLLASPILLLQAVTANAGGQVRFGNMDAAAPTPDQRARTIWAGRSTPTPARAGHTSASAGRTLTARGPLQHLEQAQKGARLRSSGRAKNSSHHPRHPDPRQDERDEYDEELCHPAPLLIPC